MTSSLTPLTLTLSASMLTIFLAQSASCAVRAEGVGSAPPPSAGCSTANNHCLPGDVVLVSPYATKSPALAAAKVMSAPTASGGEGRYMKIWDGKDVVTQYAYQTRSVHPSELSVGQEVIYFGMITGKNVYRAPKNAGEALGSNWVLARVTDPTILGNGSITVGASMVSIDNLRVADGR